MRAALAARGYRPRHALQAAAIGRVATALFLRTLRARRARATWRCSRAATRARCRSSTPLAFRARRRAVPRRAGALARRSASPPRWRHELRGPRPRAALPLPGRPRRRSTASTCTSPHGERVAVLGPNGAGKTTLMLHLNGAADAATGELEVAGPRASARDDAARAARARRARVPGPRRPAVHADRARGRRVRPAQPRARPATRSAARVDEALAAVRMAARRRPRAAPALDGPAPARRDRHRARDAPAAARARRAVREPRPARAARAARACSTASTARCSSSPTTCRSPPSCASAR